MTAVVQISNLEFEYSNGSTRLTVSSLEIDQGETVFIHGPSGCGKSTLLNLISGILSPQKGSIRVLNHNFSELSSSKRDLIRGAQVGYVFQRFNLIPYLTAFENIILPVKSSKVRRNKVDDLEKTVEELSTTLGIESILNKNVKEMSVGQQQRVAVARSFIGGPDLIIADEPTSSLDRNVTQDFMDLLIEEQRRKGFTLIFVSHDIELAKRFDRVISLEEIAEVSKC
jgi:putative ABC transport system ATP-binding protein